MVKGAPTKPITGTLPARARTTWSCDQPRSPPSDPPANQSQQTDDVRAPHYDPSPRPAPPGDVPFLLPNAWDVPSALAFADAGFPAFGTTSFGVAASTRRPDGGRASREATATLVRALADLPQYVSTDVEDGYADDPDQVAPYVAALGADGINI